MTVRNCFKMSPRSFGERCSVSEEQALQVGLQEKAREFKEAGSEVYAKA